MSCCSSIGAVAAGAPTARDHILHEWTTGQGSDDGFLNVGGINTVNATYNDSRIVLVAKGTARELRAFRPTAPADTDVHLVYVNGVSTALTCTIASGAQAAADTAHTASYQRGDTMGVHRTHGGAAGRAGKSVVIGKTTRAGTIIGGLVAQRSGGTTVGYLHLLFHTWSTIAAAAVGVMIAPTAGVAKQIEASVLSGQLTTTHTVGVEINGVASAITCTLQTTDVAARDVANTASYSAADRVRISHVQGIASPAANPMRLVVAVVAGQALASGTVPRPWQRRGATTLSTSTALRGIYAADNTTAVDSGTNQPASQSIVARPCTISSMRARVLGTPFSADSSALFVEVNGVPTAVTVTVGIGTTFVEDVAHTASATTGDVLKVTTQKPGNTENPTMNLILSLGYA